MTDAVNAGPTGTTSSGVSPTADAGTMAQAAAAMSAAATSLSENMAKFASLTENIQKIANSIADANSDSNDSMNDARSIANDFDTTHAIGGIEAMRNHMARVVHESGNDSIENARRSRNWFDKQVADVLAHDNDVRAVITDPQEGNVRSLRAFNKAGFTATNTIQLAGEDFKRRVVRMDRP